MRRKYFLLLLIVVCFGLACGFLEKKDAPKGDKTPTPSATPTAENSPTAVETKKIEEKNLLGLASGAVLLKYPKANSWQFSPVRLIDGTESFWISNAEKKGEQVFVIGLPAETVFKNFSFLNGNDYYGEGSNAKDILVEVSAAGMDDGFQKVLETSLPPDIREDQMFPATAEIPARFVRLTIKNSHANPEYVSLGDFRGYGTQKNENSLTGLTGTYFPINRDEDKGEYNILNAEEAKNAYDHYANIYLKQEGTLVYGCQEQGENDRFDGGIEGSLAQIVWTYPPEKDVEKAVLSFSPDGKLMFHTKFNDQGGLADHTAYQRVRETLGKCQNIKGFDGSGDGGKTQIEEELEKDGRAVVYGINFDFNSDRLRDESKTVLDKIVAILKQNPNWKMTVEGHTDNIGGEAFNQTLSEKRARAVVDFLTGAGIEPARLSASGKGFSNPVASNDTELGRAQNRRVELVKQ
jgi:OOP family OmpA-OmpF porin